MNESLKSESQKSRQRIAVVEEVSDNIYSVKFVLQSLGYEVLSVSVGKGSSELITRFAPHLVVVDMMISERGGYAAIFNVREHVSSKLPILAITAAAMEGDNKTVIQAGSTKTLSKPYSASELKLHIDDCIGST